VLSRKVNDLTAINFSSSSGGSRYVRFEGASRPEITVQRGVGGLENEVAIAALAQVPFDLAFHRRRQLSF
jgi:hypothetical protein